MEKEISTITFPNHLPYESFTYTGKYCNRFYQKNTEATFLLSYKMFSRCSSFYVSIQQRLRCH